MGDPRGRGASWPLWVLALVTVVVCWAGFRSERTLVPALAATVAQALLAPVVWSFLRRDPPMGLVPLSVGATHAILWLGLVGYARMVPRETPDGVRVRGEGLSILLMLHPFVAFALVLASIFLALALRFVRGRGRTEP